MSNVILNALRELSEEISIELNEETRRGQTGERKILFSVLSYFCGKDFIDNNTYRNYILHHIDHNIENNSIENLLLIPKEIKSKGDVIQFNLDGSKLLRNIHSKYHSLERKFGKDKADEFLKQFEILDIKFSLDNGRLTFLDDTRLKDLKNKL